MSLLSCRSSSDILRSVLLWRSMRSARLRIVRRPSSGMAPPYHGQNDASGLLCLSDNAQAVPDNLRPPAARDCLDCGARDGMKLQNALGTPPTNIPLLYVCSVCGCTPT